MVNLQLQNRMNTKAEMIVKIEEALQLIRPYLNADGGDVSFVEITEENIVKLQLLGACKTCSMSLMTLKAGIEDAIKRAVPEIVSVEAINLQKKPSSL